MEKPTVKRGYMRPCRGYSSKTGKRVGTRHRWIRNQLGQKMECAYCHRFYGQVAHAG